MSIRFDEIFPADVVSVQNKPYLFSNLRVERNSIPEGFYAYDVRDDCDGEFWEIQKYVMVNHWGVIVGLEPITLDERGQYWCEPEEPGISSEGEYIGIRINDENEYTKNYEKLKKYCE